MKESMWTTALKSQGIKREGYSYLLRQEKQLQERQAEVQSSKQRKVLQ